MIKQFNFYDIYGYFLPGLVFLAILTLPWVLMHDGLPFDLDAVSTLLLAPVAYVAGHVLQIFAAQLVPSSVDGRYPSDRLFDRKTDFNRRLVPMIEKSFDLHLGYGQLVTDEVSDNRDDALLLCRSALINAKAGSYGPQFEGMYSLMRGLAGAFAFGAFYLAGCWLAPGGELAPAGFCLTIVLVTVLQILHSFPDRHAKTQDVTRKDKEAIERRWALKVGAVIALVALCAGLVVVGTAGLKASPKHVVGAASLTALLLMYSCFQSYRRFTEHFARTIYRDFATAGTLVTGQKEKAGPTSAGAEEGTESDD